MRLSFDSEYSGRIKTALNCAFFALVFISSGCRKECRELGNGAYWYQDEDGPDGPGRCLLPKDREHPRPFVSIQGPYHENEYSINRPISIEILFGDNRKLDRATISISADGLADREYYRTTIDLNGKRDTFRHELQLTDRDLLGPHHIRVTVEDEFGLSDTRENVFMVIDNWRPELLQAEISKNLHVGDDVEFNATFFDTQGIASMQAELFFARAIIDPTSGEIESYSDYESISQQSIDFNEAPNTGTIEGLFSTSGLTFGRLRVNFTAFDSSGNPQTADRFGPLMKH